MIKKIFQGIFRFLSMILKYLKEGNSKKIVTGFFEIRKYAFLNIQRASEEKNCPSYFSDS